jgi:phosphatidylglycerol:prolipoprotein diacylglycerol transferase
MGPIPIYSYGFMVALGVAASLFLLAKRAKREGLSPDPWVDLALWVAVTGFLGGRIFYVVQFWDDYLGDLLGILRIWEGGVVFYGGVICALLFLGVYCRVKRISFLKVTDLLVPYAFLTQAFGRVGCFLNGCCYGKTCDLPWAVKYPFLESPVHPTQIYLSLFDLFGFVFLSYLYERRKTVGETTFAYFLTYAAGRFLIEFLRGDHRTVTAGLTVSQLISIGVVGVVSLSYFLYLRGKREKVT